MEMLLLGGQFDAIWHAKAEQQARDRHDALPKSKDIKNEQDRTELIGRLARSGGIEAFINGGLRKSTSQEVA
jgi:hypothetical protein